MRILLIILIAISCTGCKSFWDARKARILHSNQPNETVEYEPFNEVDLNVKQARRKQTELIQKQSASSERNAGNSFESSNTVESRVRQTSLLVKEADPTERILKLIEQTDDELLKRILAEKIPGNNVAGETDAPANSLTVAERRSAERIAAAQTASPSFAAQFADTPSFDRSSPTGSSPTGSSTPSPETTVDWTEIRKKQQLDPAAQRGDFGNFESGATSASVVPASTFGSATASFAVANPQEDTANGLLSKQLPSKELPSSENDSAESPARSNSNASIRPVSAKKRMRAVVQESNSDTDWQEQLTSTISQLESALKQGKAGAGNAAQLQVYLRLLHLIGNNGQQATRNISELDASEQEFWQSQIHALSSLLAQKDGGESTSLDKSPDESTDAAISHLRHALQQLKVDAKLQINNVAFCREVLGFGQYETFAMYKFRSSQDVLIYCELENFVTVRGDDSNGKYETEFKGGYEILDDSQEVIHQHQYSSVSDTGRRQRRDFYMYFPMTIPDLPPGSYFLRLKVNDLKGEKSASNQPLLPFEIH